MYKIKERDKMLKYTKEQINMLKELLQKGNFWVAKEENGLVQAFREKPHKNPIWGNWQYNRSGRSDETISFDIEEISYSDKEAIHLFELIKKIS